MIEKLKGWIEKHWLGFVVCCIAVAICIIAIYFIPLEEKDMECFRSIAQEECGDREMQMAVDKTAWGWSSDFTCCDPADEPNSRDLSKRMKHCKDYMFLEEDKEKCTTVFQYFRKKQWEEKRDCAKGRECIKICNVTVLVAQHGECWLGCVLHEGKLINFESYKSAMDRCGDEGGEQDC